MWMRRKIILADLDDEELLQQMFDASLRTVSLRQEIEGKRQYPELHAEWIPTDVLTKALVWRVIPSLGARFPVQMQRWILLSPRLLLAANAIRRHWRSSSSAWRKPRAPRVGKMVIGTAKGDIHDHGKNLVSMMMGNVPSALKLSILASNNSVEDLPRSDLEAEGPDILGIVTPLLTTTIAL